MRKREIVQLVLVTTCIFGLVPVVAFSDTAEQTDWTGGPGTTGPVTGWGDEFDTTIDINYTQDGKIVLIGDSVLTDTPRHDIDSSLGDAIYIQAVDFDNDLDYDLVGCGLSGTGDLHYYINDGSANFTRYDLSGFLGGWKSLAADLDHDGFPDIVCSDGASGEVTWYRNLNGSGFASKVVIDDTLENPLGSAVGDFDGDGDNDMIIANYQTNGLFYYYENDGSQNFTRSNLYDPPGSSQPCKLDIGDFDLDGDMDAAASVLSGGAVVVWFENEGGGVLTPRVIANQSNDGITVNDFDNDGKDDIFVGGGSQVRWYRNVDGGAGNWEYNVIATFSGADGINSADLDLDGDKDVFCSSGGSAGVRWYENQGGGTFASHDIETNFPNAHYVDIADLDGDGDEDVMSASHNADVFTWWEFQVEHDTDGELTSSILDTETSADWGIINWKGLELPSTDLYFQVRSSDDYTNMGAWSANIESMGSLDPFVTDGDRYFQYKTVLTTSDILVSPTLLTIIISWTPDYSGIDDGNPTTPITFALGSAYPNPVINFATISFALPRTCNVTLDLFDIKGRKVNTLVQGEYAAGTYKVAVGGLSSGLYLYTLTADEFADTKKIVVK